jgi:hypothetical protein
MILRSIPPSGHQREFVLFVPLDAESMLSIGIGPHRTTSGEPTDVLSRASAKFVPGIVRMLYRRRED